MKRSPVRQVGLHTIPVAIGLVHQVLDFHGVRRAAKKLLDEHVLVKSSGAVQDREWSHHTVSTPANRLRARPAG